jgi:hypothetical protein
MTLINRTLSVIADELHAALKRETDEIIDIGGLLTEAKAHMKHGEWLPWLRNEFSMSERSAQRYMKAHEFTKSATVSDFNLSPTALYLLSADNYWKGLGVEREVHEEVTAAVLKEAVKKRVGVAEAKKIIGETWKAEEREEAQRCAMESDMEDAEHDAIANGTEWGDIKDEWIKQWTAENWDEAEFEAEWKNRWADDCGPTQQAEKAARPDAEAGPVNTAPEENSKPVQGPQDAPEASDDESTCTTNEQTPAPAAKPRSAVKSEAEALSITDLVQQLVRRTTKCTAMDLAEIEASADELATLGNLLLDVANLKNADASKPTPTTRSKGNGTVSPEQSADERKAQYAALDAADDQAG